MENRMHDFDNFAKQTGEREKNERNGKKYMRNIWKDGIFGVVVGDALACPVQFETREEVAEHPIRGMRGHGTFNLPAGSWTDDNNNHPNLMYNQPVSVTKNADNSYSYDYNPKRYWP